MVWLVQLMQVGKGQGFASALEPRDWVVLLRGWPFTSWSILCSLSLCPKEPLRLQRMGGFGGRVGYVDYRVQYRMLE